MWSERKHGLSTEQVPVSAYVGSSKNLKDLKCRGIVLLQTSHLTGRVARPRILHVGLQEPPSYMQVCKKHLTCRVAKNNILHAGLQEPPSFKPAWASPSQRRGCFLPVRYPCTTETQGHPLNMKSHCPRNLVSAAPPSA